MKGEGKEAAIMSSDDSASRQTAIYMYCWRSLKEDSCLNSYSFSCSSRNSLSQDAALAVGSEGKTF